MFDFRVEGEFCEFLFDLDVSFLVLVGCDGLGVVFFFEFFEIEGLFSCFVFFLVFGVFFFLGDLFFFILVFLSLGVDFVGDEIDWLLVVFSFLFFLEDFGDVGELVINFGEDSLVLVILGEFVLDSDICRLVFFRVFLFGLLIEEVVVFLGFVVLIGVVFFKFLLFVVELFVFDIVFFLFFVIGLLIFFFGVLFFDFLF